jgi:[pyruvate, water dikinase]-phosphate phosphotransferase / [pyruvate, water dikinase] kinase
VEQTDGPTSDRHPIFIVSGGAGAFGKHAARIVLSQFPGASSEVIIVPQVRQADQLPEIVAQVATRGGVILHTMVDPIMRAALVRLAQQKHVPALDTIGDALDRIGEVFGQQPLGQPGLYRGEQEAYEARIQAIEYTVDHDDGRNPHELDKADVVLTGLSRVGKTPLSIYLSVLGWKVANVPLVREIAPPEELFQIDRRRVIGLMIDVDSLQQHRNWRQRAMRGTAGAGYIDPETLYEEIEYARRVFRRGGFSVVNATNKPIEETADEVIALISRYFEHKLKGWERR